MEKIKEVKEKLEEIKPLIASEMKQNIEKYGLKYYEDNGIIQSIIDETCFDIREVVLPKHLRNKMALFQEEIKYEDYIEK